MVIYADVALNRWYYDPTYYQSPVAQPNCRMAVAVAHCMQHYCMALAAAATAAAVASFAPFDKFAVASEVFGIDYMLNLWYYCMVVVAVVVVVGVV